MARPARVRMAPSPTGHLHVGTARTALFNYLYAKRYGATFVLRLEDTDVERSSDEYAREIVEGLQWLGIDWDEGPRLEGGEWASSGARGPYFQSQRAATYRGYLERLLASGSAYWCYCTKEELAAARAAQEAAHEQPRYAGTCRSLAAAPGGREPQVLRFKNPGGSVTFADLVRGEIRTDAGLLDDFVIAKGADAPLYNLAVVVDDIEMEISHVIRGEDHISNTSKQLLLFAALGAEPPQYGHLPLILAPDRSKMSKRTTETSLLGYREQGFLPEALLNFFALLGWHPAGDGPEIMSPAELVAAFSIERVQKSGAVFDETKLRHISRAHLQRLGAEHPERLAELLAPFLAEPVEPETLARYARLTAGSADTLADLAAGASWVARYAPPAGDVLRKGGGDPQAHLLAAAAALEGGAADFAGWLQQYQEQSGAPKKEVFWPVRVALSGLERSPDPGTLAGVLGPGAAASRLRGAAESL